MGKILALKRIDFQTCFGIKISKIFTFKRFVPVKLSLPSKNILLTCFIRLLDNIINLNKCSPSPK